MQEFELHPDLARDGHFVIDLALCRLLMIDDANYPWFVLVPRRPGLRELHELSDADAAMFWAESRSVGRTLLDRFEGDKLNVAALGNVTPQLHVHHIVRYRDDAAWPRPVWGTVPTIGYSPEVADRRIAEVRTWLKQRPAS